MRKRSFLKIFPLLSVTFTLIFFAACSSGGDDDDSGGGNGDAGTFCDRAAQCGFGDDLGFSTMAECTAYFDGLDDTAKQCVLAAANCGDLGNCLGLESDDDADDTIADDTADDDTDCVDTPTVVDPPAHDPVDDNALYSSICPDNPDPAAHQEGTYQLFDGEMKKYYQEFLPGELEAVQVVAPAPFHIKSLDFYFQGGCGEVVIRFMPDICGSEPDRTGELTGLPDLIEPIHVLIPEDAGWVNIPVPDLDFWRYPADKFWVVYEHVNAYPYLGQDSTANYQQGRNRYYTAWWASQNAPFQWGWTDYNYMVRVNGNFFCEKTGNQFTDATVDAGIASPLHRQRTVWADINSDGWDDLILNTGGYDENGFTVYLNNEGTYTDFTDDSGLNGFGAAMGVFVDLDNDGDLDAVIVVSTPEANPLDYHTTSLLNDGAGHFTEVPNNNLDVWFDVTNPTTDLEEHRRPISANITTADYDGDGCVDAFIGNWEVSYPYSTSFPDLLFKGNCDCTFTDVSLASGVGGYRDDGGPLPRPSYGSIFGDYNNDGLPDIYVANYGGSSNRLWKNNGDGTFTDVAPDVNVSYFWGDDGSPSPGTSFSADFGDFNNDGYLDIYDANITHPRYLPSVEPSALASNGGPPDYIFTNVTRELGLTCDEGEIEVSFVDYDNDGRLDIFLSDLYTGHYGRLYHQNSDGTFQDVTYWSGINEYDCTNHAWGDFDKDGDLDLLVTRRSDGYVTTLWRNDIGQDNNWVTFRLEGTETETNRTACGARVTVVAGDLTQIREVQCGRGHFNSQPSLPVEFGLGQHATIDSVEVKWPYGSTETWYAPPIKRFIHLEQGNPSITYYDE